MMDGTQLEGIKSISIDNCRRTEIPTFVEITFNDGTVFRELSKHFTTVKKKWGRKWVYHIKGIPIRDLDKTTAVKFAASLNNNI